ncbi:hypothetical protein [Parasphaerochaeta coccoides]|uniref:Uncharacterized protein n=1 Tax=Parasphaerochaeta coccoides (strain ATCC BAA-1237 / DSM 17374 / SPN1) TaxID=760011 RepID=F4GH49_PARC1|nr:hypothetical protein [Parasphaerochaeta coccoides]AEC01524.1 hypothetical protein Spico_0294 [Parasphaerochaeta coccoides DSM 17374]
MGRLQSEIAATQKEIEFARKDLDALYGEFGEHIALLHHTFPLPLCMEEFHVYSKSLEEFRVSQSQLDHFSSLVREADDHKKRMGQLKESLKELSARRGEVFSRAGAIAFEAAWAGSLPHHLEPLLPALDARQRSLAAFHAVYDESIKDMQHNPKGLKPVFSRLRATYARMKLSRLGKSSAKLFHETGRKLYDMECIVDLPSVRTVDILKELNQIDGQSAAITEDLEASRKRLDRVQGALTGEDGQPAGGGETARRIQVLTQERDAKQNVVHAQAVTYGKALCHNAASWIPNMPLPAIVMAVYDQILKHERRLFRLEERIVELGVDIDVEELELLISRDAERVVHLKDQIVSYQRQVEDILGNIDEKKKKITYLRTEGLRERKQKALFSLDEETKLS